LFWVLGLGSGFWFGVCKRVLVYIMLLECLRKKISIF
jgi:hypothetical protein